MLVIIRDDVCLKPVSSLRFLRKLRLWADSFVSSTWLDSFRYSIFPNTDEARE
jgi:hypothetical protein